MPPSISSHLSSSLSSSRSTSSLSNTLTQPSNLLPSNLSNTSTQLTTMSTNSQQQQQQQQQHHHHKNSCSTLLKLSSILPPSSTNLQIKLIEPILYFRGDTEESVGCFLRGNLILNLSKPTKIRKVEMKFVGRMRTFWPEGKLYYGSASNQNDLCEEREILSHNWTFVSTPSGTPPETPPSSPLNSCSSPCRFKMLRSSSYASPSSTLIPAGVHKYPFELFIPGNVPETIDSVRGKVNYKLSAIAVRSGLLPNMHVSQTVTIIRTVLEERNSEGIAIASEWNNQLGYDITIPKKAYPIGNSIDVDLRLSPRAKNIKIVGVKIQINEESVYKSKNQKNIESRTLSVHDVDNLGERRMTPDKNNSITNDTFQEESSSSAHQDENYLRNFYYHKIISLPIPKCTSSIYHSYKSPSINISHHLNFIFTLNSPVKSDNEDGKKKKKKSEINVNVPITLLSCRCADDLPQYEDVSYNYRRYNDDSPSYESPPSYEQSTNNNGRLRINNEIRHNSANSITTIADLRRPPPLDRLLTV